MSNCKLDHSHRDVKAKYEGQKDYLPKDLSPLFDNFFQKDHKQELLNEVFHLLKKYDLSTEEEKRTRESRLYTILKNL